MNPYIEIGDQVVALPFQQLSYLEKANLKAQNLMLSYGVDGNGRKGYCLLLDIPPMKDGALEKMESFLPDDYTAMALMGLSAGECLALLDRHSNTASSRVILLSGYGEVIPSHVKAFVQKEYNMTLQ